MLFALRPRIWSGKWTGGTVAPFVPLCSTLFHRFPFFSHKIWPIIHPNSFENRAVLSLVKSGHWPKDRKRSPNISGEKGSKSPDCNRRSFDLWVILAVQLLIRKFGQMPLHFVRVMLDDLLASKSEESHEITNKDRRHYFFWS